MAVYREEWRIYVGDLVAFEDSEGVRKYGRVQDISHLPDVWVELVDGGIYKRYCMGVNKFEVIDSEYDDSGRWSSGEIGKDEVVEFIHKGDLGTEGFGELVYFKSGGKEVKG